MAPANTRLSTHWSRVFLLSRAFSSSSHIPTLVIGIRGTLFSGMYLSEFLSPFLPVGASLLGSFIFASSLMMVVMTAAVPELSQVSIL